MSVSTVGIINQALYYIGEEPITSLDDNSKPARVASAYYETARDALLEYPDEGLSFSIYRQDLALSSETNETNYTYMYSLPSDPWCLKPLSLVGYENWGERIWLAEGRFLYCNLEAVTLKYVRRVEDPRWFSGAFQKAIAYRMAADMASGVTGNPRIDLEQLATQWLFTAIGQDSRASGYHYQGKQTWKQHHGRDDYERIWGET